MAATPASHPSDQALRAYGQGRLDDRSTGPVEGHLASCRDCRRRLAELTADGSSDREDGARARPDSPPPVGSSLPGPSRPAVGPVPSAETLPPGLAENTDYEVIRELGRGGMGVVYLARNKLMGRQEVLKVVSGHLLDRGTVRERFLREIRNAAQLHHPNIVTAYSALRAGDQIVLAMEHVDGYDLARLVKEGGPLAVAHAANFAYQAAQGLQHAHERGMVHRDIKPNNLMLARDGARATVKILDFGLAKATQEAPVEGGLTREGQMLGTPDYIAPEQSLDAQKADIRADIYSLGCTLYYLLTGGPPFEAHSLYEILQAHHSRDAMPLNLVRPDVPVELAALVAKMMAKAPGHRFQTPGEVAKALRPFFKPGEGVAVAGSGRIAASTGGQAAGPGAAATLPRAPRAAAPAPASTFEEKAPAKAGSPLHRIDLRQEQGLAPGRPTAEERARTRPPWLWISVAAGALLLCAVLAWSLVVETARRKGETASGPPVASSRQEPPHRNEGAPRDEAPPARPGPRPEEPARPSVPKGQTQEGGISPREAIQKAPSAAIVQGRDGPGPSAEPVRKVVRTEDKVEKTAPSAVRPGDIRQLRAIAGPFRPANPGAQQPTVGFWPMARPDEMTAWQVSDAGRFEMDRDGVSLSAGPGGNFLLTRRDTYRSCKLSITLSAQKGTEAFLALRAHLGPDGWRAITARVHDEGGRIRVGYQAIDFQPADHPPRGARPETVAPDKSFHIRFEIDGRDVAQLVANKETSSMAYAKTPVVDYRGAAGVFVKSGTLVIHAMDVQE
jgi:Protein kinase domain